MKPVNKHVRMPLASALAGIVLAACTTGARATNPCGDFGECKVLIEINASDGDIGFHFLADGTDLNSLTIRAPRSNGKHQDKGRKIFQYRVSGPLKKQKLTETFAESAEPPCFDTRLDDDPDNDDEEFVTLTEFLERWSFGTYTFHGRSDGGERSWGSAVLTKQIPAAPTDVDFDADTGVVSWNVGDDLDTCSDPELGLDGALAMLIADGIIELVTEPDAWEVVLEPNFDDESDDPAERALAARYNKLKFTTRVAGDAALPGAVTVPEEYLMNLPPNSPVKVEVGGIAGADNGTFTEEDGFCVNEDDTADSYCED
jgi:hypothetical protein